MTTIKIKNNVKLSKTEFDSLEDLQIELILQQEKYQLSEEHIEILVAREKEADYSTIQGSSWSEVKNNIKRKNV